MRWQIENFVFCDDQQTLKENGNVIKLEPILVELLSYFCQHSGQIISRTELIEAVWLGRLVTDSAVNRSITKLRRCFSDNPKSPLFIATFPKKGYKFVARVSVIKPSKPEELAEFLEAPKHRSKSNLKNRWLLVACLAISTCLSILYLGSDHQDSFPGVQITPMTSASGQEFHPKVSPDLQYLAYTELADETMRLYIQHLSSGSKIEIRPVDDELAWIGPGSWNNEGNEIVYLVTTENYCRYYMQPFHNMELGQAKLIHNCPQGSYGKIAFTHSSQLLVYAERRHARAPYELFKYDVISGSKQRINQPPLILAGNMSFDLHPKENKLLVSSPDEQLWEAFYSVDLNTDELKQLFKLDEYVCCGIWDHSGERIVLMGEYPARQLVSYDLHGNGKRVIYRGWQRIFAPERHTNQKDYVFPIGKGNLDIKLVNASSLEVTTVANNSVDDRLPAISSSEDKIAYISLASGSEELWVFDIESGKHTQLSQFEEQIHFVDIAFSHDGNLIAGLTLNEIYLIELKPFSYQVLRIPQSEIRSISFKDNQFLYYSVKQREKWRIYSYHLASGKVESLDEQWQFVKFDKEAEDTLWVDQLNNLYSGTTPRPIAKPNNQDFEIMLGSKINLKKKGKEWFWQSWKGDHYQLFKQDENGRVLPLAKTDTPHFEVVGDGVLYQLLESQDIDIFQTVYVP